MKSKLTHELAAVSMIALAACSDAAGTDSQLESVVTLDVALVSADAIIADVAEQGHVFPPPEGVSTVTYYDAFGDVQESFDEVTTASIHILREGNHEGGRENWTGSVSKNAGDDDHRPRGR